METNAPQGSDVSVVIVSYHTKDELRTCLSCIEPEHQIIVVDNASTDGSPEMVEQDFPNVQLIRLDQNVGFGAANNIGARKAERRFTLFLNSDAYAKSGAIQKLAEAMDRLEANAVGGRLLNVDGSLQQSVAGPLTLTAVFLEQSGLEKLLKRYWRTPTASGDHRVWQVMGACFCIRTGSIEFDERFFLYCEDTDLFKRLHDTGRDKIFYIADAEFTHVLGASSVQNRWLSVARYNAGKELFFKIHFGSSAYTMCLILDRMGAFARLLAWSMIGLFRFDFSNARLWWKVFTAPLGEQFRPGRSER